MGRLEELIARYNELCGYDCSNYSLTEWEKEQAYVNILIENNKQEEKNRQKMIDEAKKNEEQSVNKETFNQDDLLLLC